jgi:phosphoribosylglycinamide formyltransferase-1
VAFRVALLASGAGTTADAVIRACVCGRTHPDPSELDAAVAAALAEFEIDLVALVGYMKQLGPRTLEAYAGRVLNTHPALLPAFGGQGMYGDRVHHAVLDAGVATSGATVHHVVAEYDAGPIVRQIEVAVVGTDTVDTLGARVRTAERELLVDVLADWARSARVSNRGVDGL